MCSHPCVSKQSSRSRASSKRKHSNIFNSIQSLPVTGPECKPNRISKLLVSGPSLVSSFLVSSLILRRTSLANLHIATWCSLFGVGQPRSSIQTTIVWDVSTHRHSKPASSLRHIPVTATYGSLERIQFISGVQAVSHLDKLNKWSFVWIPASDKTQRT